MIWWGISGSWRHTLPEIEADVRDGVRELMTRGDGIVSGGALNVDYFATDEALRHSPAGRQIRIIIPTPLNIYASHYRQRAGEGVITILQAEQLIAQLEQVKKHGSLTEMDFTVCDEQSYYARNSAVIEASTALLAFQVNESAGVQDTVDKAQACGLRVVLKKYSL